MVKRVEWPHIFEQDESMMYHWVEPINTIILIVFITSLLLIIVCHFLNKKYDKKWIRVIKGISIVLFVITLLMRTIALWIWT